MRIKQKKIFFLKKNQNLPTQATVFFLTVGRKGVVEFAGFSAGIVDIMVTMDLVSPSMSSAEWQM